MELQLSTSFISRKIPKKELKAKKVKSSKMMTQTILKKLKNPKKNIFFPRLAEVGLIWIHLQILITFDQVLNWIIRWIHSFRLDANGFDEFPGVLPIIDGP